MVALSELVSRCSTVNRVMLGSNPARHPQLTLTDWIEMSFNEHILDVSYEGETYYGQIAEVTSVSLGPAHHGIWSAYLNCAGKSWGIGVGGFTLDNPVKNEDGTHSHREGTGWGMDHIMKLVDTVGAESWEDCVGKYVIVLFKNNNSLGQSAIGIANITDPNKVYLIERHVNEWKATHKDSE